MTTKLGVKPNQIAAVLGQAREDYGDRSAEDAIVFIAEELADLFRRQSSTFHAESFYKAAGLEDRPGYGLVFAGTTT